MASKEWSEAPVFEGDSLSKAILDMRDVDDAEAFLNPDWDTHTHSPYLFKQIEAAAERVLEALEKGEEIVIHGDYDADGVSGSTLMHSTLEEVAAALNLKMNVRVFLPDRERDGYGLAMHTMDDLGQGGTKLLITVDCGISNIKEIARARELGMDVIVCDHHQLAESGEEPDAFIIHPLAKGETYPNKHLCGTGVAFKLASVVLDKARERGGDIQEGYEKWLLDLVAIATVTDIMPLTGENRVLEKYGLIVLEKTRRPGLKALLEHVMRPGDRVNTELIGFRIGPRLNAPGRISHAAGAFEALSAGPEAAAEKVFELEALNRKRQSITEKAVKEAMLMAKEQGERKSYVLKTDYWNPGIVGLIAGKVSEKFTAPVFALTKVGEQYVGSGRSAGGMHLVEAMQSCGDIFVKAGGHPQACGLTLAEESDIELFRDGIETFAAKHFGDGEYTEKLEIDFELPLHLISKDLLDDIIALEPFGNGHTEPVFVTRGVSLSEARTVGAKDKHLRVVSSGDARIAGIAFGLGQLAEEIEKTMKVDLVYHLRENNWNGRISPQFMIKDIRPV
jgi:single-stranded-DNA-specific exonuclease